MEPRSKKILIGCSLGCVGLLVLCLGSCFGFMYWVSRPGELLQPQVLLGSDTTGYIEWTLSLEDPGTQEFVERLLGSLRDLNDRRAEMLPEIFRPLLQLNDRRNERNFRELFPVVTAWTMHPSSGFEQEEQHLFTFSIEKFGNRIKLADWMMGAIFSRSPDIRVTQHMGEKIYQLIDRGEELDVTFFIRSPDIFFTSGPETSRQAIDRLNQQAEEEMDRMPTEFERVFGVLPQDQPLRGVISNEHQEMEKILQGVLPTLDRRLPREAIDATRMLSLACGFVNSSDLGCRFEALWEAGVPDAVAIESVDGALEATFREVGLEATHRVTTRSDRLVIDLTIKELTELLELIPNGNQIRIEQGRSD